MMLWVPNKGGMIPLYIHPERPAIQKCTNELTISAVHSEMYLSYPIVFETPSTFCFISEIAIVKKSKNPPPSPKIGFHSILFLNRGLRFSVNVGRRRKRYCQSKKATLERKIPAVGIHNTLGLS